jgi:small subunit ribosomal protein S25e
LTNVHTRNRSKGKVKDKAQHAVLLDKATSDKLYKDVQSYRLVTVATLVDRLKINGSLARKCIKDLEEKGMIKVVVEHSRMKIYSMSAGYRIWPPMELDADLGHSSRCRRCGINTPHLTQAMKGDEGRRRAITAAVGGGLSFDAAQCFVRIRIHGNMCPAPGTRCFLQVRA